MERAVGGLHWLNIEQRIRGVILQQVKGPGSPIGASGRVTSPGRAGRYGIFARG